MGGRSQSGGNKGTNRPRQAQNKQKNIFHEEQTPRPCAASPRMTPLGDGRYGISPLALDEIQGEETLCAVGNPTRCEGDAAPRHGSSGRFGEEGEDQGNLQILHDINFVPPLSQHSNSDKFEKGENQENSQSIKIKNYPKTVTIGEFEIELEPFKPHSMEQTPEQKFQDEKFERFLAQIAIPEEDEHIHENNLQKSVNISHDRHTECSASIFETQNCELNMGKTVCHACKFVHQREDYGVLKNSLQQSEKLCERFRNMAEERRISSLSVPKMEKNPKRNFESPQENSESKKDEKISNLGKEKTQRDQTEVNSKFQREGGNGDCEGTASSSHEENEETSVDTRENLESNKWCESIV